MPQVVIAVIIIAAYIQAMRLLQFRRAMLSSADPHEIMHIRLLCEFALRKAMASNRRYATDDRNGLATIKSLDKEAAGLHRLDEHHAAMKLRCEYFASHPWDRATDPEKGNALLVHKRTKRVQ
jgi:hypothetical protein